METSKKQIEYFLQPAINTGFQTLVGCNEYLKNKHAFWVCFLLYK